MTRGLQGTNFAAKFFYPPNERRLNLLLNLALFNSAASALELLLKLFAIEDLSYTRLLSGTPRLEDPT